MRLAIAAVLLVTLEPYTFKTFDGRDVAAERGAIMVPEVRRGAGGGAQRRVSFVRLRSTAEKPAAPIVFLMGGPGIPGNVMLRVPPYYDLFNKLTAVADVIVYDYRGVGMSEPLLDCKYPEPPPRELFAGERAAREWFRANVRWCVAEWRKRGLDARNYGAEANADDLDDLRTALGVPKISLLAFSYGTDVALAAVQRHGDHLERVVLASVDAPDAGLKRPALWDMQLRRASPDLERTVRAMMPRLDVQTLLRTSMGSRRSFDPAAQAIVALAGGDDAPFATAMAKLTAGLQSAAMSIAVSCTRPQPPERRARVTAEAKGAIFSAVNLQWDESICREVVPETILRRAAPRIWSELPALFVSGGLDANTPAAEVEEVRFGFPHGKHLIVDDGWHETLPLPAVQEAVVDFFRR
jgi:pimeloyl-ACP methyl ester carboxylesterase